MPILLGPAIGAGLGISAGAGSLIAGVVFTVGSTLLTFLLAPKPDTQDGKIPFRQPIQPRGYGYGATRVAGATMYHEAVGGNGGKLLIVQALLSHPCDSYLTYYLHEDEVEFYSGAKVQKVDGSKGYTDKVFLYTRLGAIPETAVSEIFAATITGSQWTANHRGDGITYIAMRCDDADEDSQAKKFPNGKPIVSAAIATRKVYDPRAVSPSQDPADESTWVYSDNPVLCILHFLCFNEFGFQRDYDTSILPYVDSWIAAADNCDEQVALFGGGTENRYRLGGNATTEHAQRAVLGQMLAACDGWMVDRGDGGIDIRVGVFEEPTIILTDDDIVGFDLPYGIADEEVVNRLDATFTEPNNKYTEAEVEPWQNEADQASRGMVREHRFELKWVPSPTQTRRLSKREYTRLQEPLRGTLDIRLNAIDAVYARWIRVQSATIPQLADKVIENRAGHLSLLTGALRIAFIGSGSHIDDWTPETDEGDLPVTPTPLTEQELTPPTNVTIDYIEFTNADGGIVRALRVVFDEPPSFHHYVVRWTWIEDTPDGPVTRSGSETFTAAVAVGGVITLLTSMVIPEVAALSVQVASKSPSATTLSDYQPEPAVVLDTRSVTSTTAAGTELREDGTAELREDGSLELRETT
jgi:hypothetical protein